MAEAVVTWCCCWWWKLVGGERRVVCREEWEGRLVSVHTGYGRVKDEGRKEEKRKSKKEE